MLHADYLLVPSRHEAAPMVFDEASVLGLRIVSTNTTSAAEMVGGDGGIVCENSPEGIPEALVSLHKDSGKKRAAKSNQLQREQFAGLIG
jgi:glycosyltransferase involved in cell wall biosynthesis